MQQTTFMKATDRMIKAQPYEDKDTMNSSVRFFLDKRLTSFESLRRALGTLAPDALIAAIRLFPYLDRQRAASALLPILRRNPDPLIRLETAKTLATLGRKRTTRTLLACLDREKNTEVRYWLAYAISCLADPNACMPFLRIMQDRNEEAKLRSQCVEGLAYVLPHIDKRRTLYKRAVKGLIDMLDDIHPEVRFWAAFALGTVRARGAIKKLRQLADKDDAMCPGLWPVSVEAADAIQVIEGGEWPERRGSDKEV